jgi:glycine hydroxymethyltransferase
MSKQTFQALLSKVESLEGVQNKIRHQMEELVQSIIHYEEKSEELLRLIPTEGIMSHAARMLMTSIANERYLHAAPGEDLKAIRYPDIADLQTIQAICTRSLRAVLNAGFVNVDALSGLDAMQMSLLAFAEPGELVLALSPEDGGHQSTEPMAKLLSRKICFMPFDHKNHVVDVTKLDRTLKPAMIYLDHSNILRPHNLLALEQTYPDTKIVFDISHVFGSIAADVFENPLEHGAHAVVGSTHKSLNGPQKAIFATNRSEMAEKYSYITKVFISNNHPGNVAALAMTLLEFMAFGSEYGTQMVRNANVLAEALEKEGIPVYGTNHDDKVYTHTAHVWVDCEKMGWRAEDAVQYLYRRCGIVVNTLYLAKGGEKSEGAKGLRLGTTEVTRLGMLEKEMRKISRMIANALLRKQEPEKIFKARLELKEKFTRVEYCIPFEDDNQTS